MTTRPRTANKTAAAKPAARKATAAKRTTSATPARTARKRTTSQNKPDAPKLSLVKARKLSLVKPRRPLPTRQREFVTDPQIYATHAARQAGLPIHRIRDWTDHADGTATRILQDGTLHYTHPTRTLTWQATCRMGAVHTYVLDSPSTAAAARVQAASCEQLHADLTGIEPPTRRELSGLELRKSPTWARPDLPGEAAITQTVPVPLADRRDRALGDTLTHSGNGVADTQPLSYDEIGAHIAQQLAADTETTKEHPQP